MGVYGDIAVRAWNIITADGMPPGSAWLKAVGERYTDPNQLKNALKHTCPKGAFLGLCQNGLVRDIPRGHYTRSRTSSAYALEALHQLRADPTLADRRADLELAVFIDRTPNDEVDVVIALFSRGLLCR